MCFVAIPAAAAAGSSAAAAAAAQAAITAAIMTNAAVASAIVGVAGAGVSYYGSQQQASYQEKAAQYQYQVQMQNRATAQAAQERQFEITSREAEDSAKMAYLLNAKRSREFEQQAAQEIYAVAQQSQKSAGAARVSAAEMGTAGISVEALLKDFTRQELNYQTAVLREQENRAYMSNVERTAIQQQQQARLAGAMPQPLPIIGAPVLPPRPTFLAAGLEMAGSVADLYSNRNFVRSLTIQRML